MILSHNLGCGVWGVGCGENSRYFSVRAPRLRKENRFREPESLTGTEISVSHRDEPRRSQKR
ncbi:MAG: hypothetical protein F6J93_37480 [Oscillatoria sp. SIO1A7]|nr:hypothetical protein [Oscillatoria sp. SIO1A7]